MAGIDGGGILNIGTLTITDSTISGNTADADGNGAGDGGGIFNGSVVGAVRCLKCNTHACHSTIGGAIKRWNEANSSTPTELKPCPFCGGEANLEIVTPPKSGARTYCERGWVVWADNVSVRCATESCIVRETRYFSCKKTAIEVWNTRTEPKP